MQIEIQWTQDDLERKLLEELATSGFRVVEESGDDGSPKPKFRWTFKPGLKVTVRAEPDPTAVIPESQEVVHCAPFAGAAGAPTSVMAQNGQTVPSSEAAPLPEEEDDDTPLDPTMFPPGTDMRALRALEQAAKDEKAGKPIQRKRMAGESHDRPED